eukprot:973328-Amphidinium_carterae.1
MDGHAAVGMLEREMLPTCAVPSKTLPTLAACVCKFGDGWSKSFCCWATPQVCLVTCCGSSEISAEAQSTISVPRGTSLDAPQTVIRCTRCLCCADGISWHSLHSAGPNSVQKKNELQWLVNQAMKVVRMHREGSLPDTFHAQNADNGRGARRLRDTEHDPPYPTRRLTRLHRWDPELRTYVRSTSNSPKSNLENTVWSFSLPGLVQVAHRPLDVNFINEVWNFFLRRLIQGGRYLQLKVLKTDGNLMVVALSTDGMQNKDCSMMGCLAKELEKLKR